MSEEANIIKEFLVALGFTTDEPALKRFQTGIDRATKSAERLAEAVTATAVSVAYGVARMAGDLESLYFASVRTGASATHLRAFARAAQDFGATSGEAMSSVEGLARAIRNNPGVTGQINGWLSNVGKSVGSDPVENLKNIGLLFAQNTRNGNQYLNTQLAQMWGIDEKTMLAIQQPGFGADFGSIDERLKRAGFGDAARQAHAFMMSLRKLGDQLVVLGVQIQNTLQQKLGISVNALTGWLRKNGPWLASEITNIVGQMLDDFNRLVLWFAAHGPQIKSTLKSVFGGIEDAYLILRPAVTWIFDKLSSLNEMTGGWLAKIGTLLLILRAVGATEIVGGILSLALAVRKLGAALLGLAVPSAAAPAAGAIAGTVLPLVTATATGVGLGYLLDKFFPHNWLARAGNFIGGKFFDQANKGSDLIERLTDLGWTRAQATGIAANIIAEDPSLDPHAVGDNGLAYGIGQWHPDRQADFKRLFGHDIRQSSYAEQLQFFNYELRHGHEQKAGRLLMAAKNARRAAEVVSLYDLRPRGGAAEAAARGKEAVYLSQHTIINVSGAKDPQQTGREVANHQVRVNAQMVRAASAVPR